MARPVRMSAGVEIEGLRDFLRELNAIGDEYPDAVKKANFDLASAIAERAKERAGSAGVPTARRVAQSLRASRSGRSSMVSGGGPAYPTFWGAEFGAKQWPQFRPWRGNQWGGWSGGPGYFLHPTIRDDGRKFIDHYVETLRALERKAFPS